MNRVIRARIKVNSVIENGWIPKDSDVEQKDNEQISAGAVYSEDKNSENYSFSKATPSLSLNMTINNPNAFGILKKDMEYYLDFIPAEDSATRKELGWL